jgi:hypothetical protein
LSVKAIFRTANGDFFYHKYQFDSRMATKASILHTFHCYQPSQQ